MEQTRLSESQDIFLEEISGLISMLKHSMQKHEAVEQYYLDLVGMMRRIEDKIDNIDRRITHLESV